MNLPTDLLTRPADLLGRLRPARVAAAVAAAATMTLAQAGLADVGEAIPADALVVVKVKNLEQVNGDWAALAREWTLDQMDPDLADPLASFQEETGMQQGVKADGDAALYLPKGADLEGDDAPFVLLVPVTSFDEFKGNLQNAQEQGGVTAGELNGEPVFVSDMGDYAAVAFTEGAAPTEMPGEALDPSGVTEERMEERDMTLYANFAELGPLLTKLLQEENAKEQFKQQITEGFADAPAGFQQYRPVAEAAADQLFAVATSFLRDAEAATVSLDLDPEAGIGANVVAQFKGDSYLAGTLGELPAGEGSMLSGLPQGQYLMFGGSAADEDGAVLKLLKDTLGPVAEQLQEAGGEPVQAFVDKTVKLLEASKSSRFGLFAPSGNVGQDPVIQSVTLVDGDAEQIKRLSVELPRSRASC